VNISSQEQPYPQGAAPAKSVKDKKLEKSADIESISDSTNTDAFVAPVTWSGKK
jgi:hypothetical protein